jgi:DNA-binding beta-propeller fold protein YncE
VSKIDPIANNVIATVAVGSRPNGIVFDGTNIWVANTGQNFLSKINMNGTSSENVLVNINIQIVNVGYNGRLIYVSLRQGDQGNLDYGLVIAFDPKDGSSGSVCFVCVGAQQFASDGYRMWVANENRSLIGFGLSPLDDARVDLIFSPRSLAFDGKDIWATSPINDAVYKINPDGESTGLMIEVGDSPLGIAFDGTSIWVANSGSNSVSKIPV